MSPALDLPGRRTDLECPEPRCEARMELRDSRFGLFYGCTRYPACDGTHGAHPDGSPLGVPADYETKRWRERAHEALDPLWKIAPSLPCYEIPRSGEAREEAIRTIRQVARQRTYRWIAFVLRISTDEAHIGAFDARQCQRVEVACELLVKQFGGSRVQAASYIRRWAKGGSG